jgi:hypothetical protein
MTVLSHPGQSGGLRPAGPVACEVTSSQSHLVGRSYHRKGALRGAPPAKGKAAQPAEGEAKAWVRPHSFNPPYAATMLSGKPRAYQRGVLPVICVGNRNSRSGTSAHRPKRILPSAGTRGHNGIVPTQSTSPPRPDSPRIGPFLFPPFLAAVSSAKGNNFRC